MPDSLKVIYTPHPSMPSNFPANFPVRGWGHVVLKPNVEEELAIVLCRALLSQLPKVVRLANPADWVHLGEGFEHLDPTPKPPVEEQIPPVTSEASPESVSVDVAEEPTEKSVLFPKPRTKPAKVGDK